MEGQNLVNNIILCSILIVSSFLINPSLSELCHPNDKKILLQIKKAFNDPYVLASWEPNTDCCKWYFVTCDFKTHRITDLFIAGGGLSGPIPPQIADLPYLQTMEFYNQPNLTGPIPPTITKLKTLKRLTISLTKIKGPVPDFLAKLENLESLDLSYNSFSGPIPCSLALLSKLTKLRLDRNKLMGPVPSSFGEFKGSDFYLELSHNLLSGIIPASFGDKDDFGHVDLSMNRLKGDPNLALFGPGGKKRLYYVDLSRNLFEFDLSKVQFPKSLVWLDLNHNKIRGTIPVGLTVPNLKHLNVSYNRLCGKIPVGGELQRFDYSAYFHNQCLCGAPLQKCKY